MGQWAGIINSKVVVGCPNLVNTHEDHITKANHAHICKNQVNQPKSQLPT